MKKMMFLILVLAMNSFVVAEDDFDDDFSENSEGSSKQSGFNFSGFFEIEQGANITGQGPLQRQDDPQDYVMANRRLRLESSKTIDNGGAFAKIDFVRDEISDRSYIDIRELRVYHKLFPWSDLSVGKQVSTWGVGDMLFINDLFPKNWVANFQGRDMEYLKDSSYSARMTNYFGENTLDIVYTPKFSPDTIPTGCSFSTYNPNSGVLISDSTCAQESSSDRRSNSYKDGEVAAMFKRSLLGQEIALYFYQGYYKAPKGLKMESGQLAPHYPRLTVAGASTEGQIGWGILTGEIGHYNSHEDKDGNNPLIENSTLKYLLGYKMDLSANWSTGVQWYQEKMLDYDSYKAANSSIYRKDELQNTFTLRLTHKAQQETLISNLFAYYRPQDKDSFIKLDITKKINDDFAVTGGANIFTGKDNYENREFGMLRNDDNVFIRFRFSI